MNWFKIKSLILNKLKITGTDKLKMSDQIFLFRNLYDLFQSGFTFYDALKFLKVANFNSYAVTQMLERLERGEQFSNCIRPFISSNLCDQIQMAEKHGNILSCLETIVDYVDLKCRQKRKLKEIIMYPLFLLILLISIIIGIKVLVLPQLNGLVQKDSSKPLNFYLMGFILLILIIMMLSLIDIYLHRPKFEQIDLIIKIPLIGKICRDYYGYYIANNLSLMIKSGMNINDILNIMKNFGSDSLMHQLGQEVSNTLNQGKDFKAVSNRHSFIPNQVYLFLSKGDSLDVVAKNLNAFSKLCFKQIELRTNRLITFIQPAIFALIGIAIITTYLNMLMPMYQSLRGIY
ncbi:secretion protein F [Philodulcilactobacillus myokoensis]|uniref:Secretion protein F n=1 Tax=Philodulcilactobacillus myokoensis TaxID=2929573 RepID=A0A9W6ES33_9LACO|nr:competence type IV pilus assembly protein ComGB [Philodulcilactobacillus myokoensis]GLB46701.1 secretion protein F [Philodulcilactobacillus myokoensis]